MSSPEDSGVGLAQAAQQLIGTRLAEDPGASLGDLAGALSHLNAKPAVWQTALALIAAQEWKARRTSDGARAHDASFALSQVAAQVDWARARGVLRDA